MGSYGIGLGRLMGTVVEVLSDERGIVWPESIAPFRVHMLALGNDDSIFSEAKDLYNKLNSLNIEVLYDDRKDMSAGEKFADADLIGIPYRVVLSPRSKEQGGVEVKKRTEEKGGVISVEELIKILNA
jgi:prolyl-tRNA synthetase